MAIVFTVKEKEKLRGLEEDRKRWNRELRKSSPGSERHRDCTLMILQLDVDIEKLSAHLETSQEFTESEKGESLKKIQKGETKMNNVERGYSCGQVSADRAAFAEFCQLTEKRRDLIEKQKLLGVDSVWFAQGKAALRKIDERIDELRPTIPEIHFHPEEAVGINKSITSGTGFLATPSGSLRELEREIAKAEDALKNCGPSQDRGAMARDLEKLRQELSIKSDLARPHLDRIR